MPQLQAFIDTCHKIICDFIRGRGHKVPDKHVSAHMGKLGLKKLLRSTQMAFATTLSSARHITAWFLP